MSEPGSGVKKLTLLQALAEVVPAPDGYPAPEDWIVGKVAEMTGATVDRIRQALYYLHKNGMASRDLGRDNVFVWRQRAPEGDR